MSTISPEAAVLAALAESVRAAERAVSDKLYWVRLNAERVASALSAGESMNSLGELQANGVGLDVAISRLETAVDAFTVALDALPDDGWLDGIVDRSPRLTAEVTRRSARRSEG